MQIVVSEELIEQFRARTASASTSVPLAVLELDGRDVLRVTGIAEVLGPAPQVVYSRGPVPGYDRVEADFHVQSGIPAELQVIPGLQHLFSRQKGVLESDLLQGKRLVIVGMGSVGSVCAVELVKSGFMQFTLVDFDRLELTNIARHACGLKDLGRYKTRAVADLLLDKNPYCTVTSCDWDLTQHPEELEAVVAAADLVLVATDNNHTRFAVNRHAVTHGKPVIFGRARKRAVGGDVLRVRPGETPCYQCIFGAFYRNVPEETSQPVSAYGGTLTMAAEPGLALDIDFISLMMVKLAIQEMVRDTGSTLNQTLPEDLAAPLYLWANRREAGVGFADWTPLSQSALEMTILRWYGVDYPRDPDCPACGDFVSAALAGRGLDEIREEERSLFRGSAD